MADDYQRWHGERLLETAAAALEKNGFQTAVCSNREEALAYCLAAAENAATIGFGGSMSLSDLELAQRLATRGKHLLIHGRPGLTPVQRREIMQQQLACDLFFTGTNALTLDGKLVNIDATGNRVCSMAFGPQKVVVVAGVNKLCSDVDAALKRVKEVACPPNAKRLGFNTPCAKTGVCSDCRSPERICRITTIIDFQPRASAISVCLVNEPLGY